VGVDDAFILSGEIVTKVAVGTFSHLSFRLRQIKLGKGHLVTWLLPHFVRQILVQAGSRLC